MSYSWATPCRQFDVKTYQEGGTVVKDTYTLNMFERNVQIESIRSVDLPMLIYILRYVQFGPLLASMVNPAYMV